MLSANIKSQEYYEGEYEFAFGDIQIGEGLILSANEDGCHIEYEIPQFYEDYAVVNTSEDIESLQITNLNGEIVYNSDNVTDNTTIPVYALSESIYCVVAQTSCGDILNKKIIVKH